MPSFMIYHDRVYEAFRNLSIYEPSSIQLLRALGLHTIILFPDKMQCRNANHSGIHRFLFLYKYHDST